MNPFNPKASGASRRVCDLRRVDCARPTASPPSGNPPGPMPNSTSNPKVAFLVVTSRDVGHRIAQLLALGELMGPCWLRATMLCWWIQ